MKINQRLHYSQQQKPFHSHHYNKSKNHVPSIVPDQEQFSLDSIQTPGWTSLVRTQNSKQIKNVYHWQKQFTNNQQANYPNEHQSVLNRLNSLPKLDKAQQFYSNIRLHPSTSSHNKNIIIYESSKIAQTKRNQTPKMNTNKFLKKFNSHDRQNKKVSKFMSVEQNKFKSAEMNKFMSVQKSNQKKFNSNTKLSPNRQRVSSVKSQPVFHLKDLINQKLSLGSQYKSNSKTNFNQINHPSDFNSKLTTQENEIIQRNQNTIKLLSKGQANRNHNQPKFYSKIHNPLTNNTKNSQKNQYLNKYLNKLHQRSLSSSTAKIVKKQKPKNAQSNNNQNRTSFQQINRPVALSRFNTITVHDHLYHDSIKLQSKKNMTKMIDQSYKKSTILTFTPQISQRSNALAQSKFIKQNKYRNQQNGDIKLDKKQDQNHSASNFHSNCLNKTAQSRLSGSNFALKPKTIFTIQEKVSMKQKQRMKQKLQNRIVLKLFNLLSCNTQSITQKTLQKNIQKLPLSLIELLEPLLTKIYQKNQYKMEQFIQVFTQDKQNKFRIGQLAVKKIAIINLTEKYLKHTNNCQKKQLEEKENINLGNVNLQIYMKQRLKLNK